MKIKNLRISDNGKKRIAALLLTGVTLVTTGGCMSSRVEEGELIANQTQVFEPGQHIITVAVDSGKWSEIRQFSSADGYTPIDIAYENDKRILLVFTNTETVECQCSGITNDEFIYEDFGIPVGKTESVSEVSSLSFDEGAPEYVTYEPREHIVIYTTDYSHRWNFVTQYSYHEGYSVVGIGVSKKNNARLGGCCVLYVNDVPVECKLKKMDFSDSYVYNFGTPVNTKVLKR